MSNVINLNQFRKSREKQFKRKKADENSVKHGLSKQEKELFASLEKQADGRFEAHKREIEADLEKPRRRPVHDPKTGPADS